jgi:hypothetical protein
LAATNTNMVCHSHWSLISGYSAEGNSMRAEPQHAHLLQNCQGVHFREHDSVLFEKSKRVALAAAAPSSQTPSPQHQSWLSKRHGCSFPCASNQIETAFPKKE